jgi:hypothetical protein
MHRLFSLWKMTRRDKSWGRECRNLHEFLDRGEFPIGASHLGPAVLCLPISRRPAVLPLSLPHRFPLLAHRTPLSISSPLLRTHAPLHPPPTDPSSPSRLRRSRPANLNIGRPSVLRSLFRLSVALVFTSVLLIPSSPLHLGPICCSRRRLGNS